MLSSRKYKVPFKKNEGDLDNCRKKNFFFYFHCNRKLINFCLRHCFAIASMHVLEKCYVRHPVYVRNWNEFLPSDFKFLHLFMIFLLLLLHIHIVLVVFVLVTIYIIIIMNTIRGRERMNIKACLLCQMYACDMYV